MAAADVDQRIRDTQREYAEFLDDYVMFYQDIDWIHYLMFWNLNFF